MGELSIDDIQKAFHHFDVPSQNISISNKSFEVNAAQSSVLVYIHQLLLNNGYQPISPLSYLRLMVYLIHS